MSIKLTARNITTHWGAKLPHFEIASGETLLLLGACNTGKSEILLDFLASPKNTAQDVTLFCERTKTCLSVSNEAVFLPSSPYLFFSGIRKNVLGELILSKEWSSNELSESDLCKYISDFKLDLLLDSNPFNLSGGEATRLMFACALLKRPKLILIDQSYDALDYNSKYLVKEAVERYAGNESAVIIESISRYNNGLIKKCIILEKNSARWSQNDDFKAYSLMDTPFAGSPGENTSKDTCINVSAIKYAYPNSCFQLGPISFRGLQGEVVGISGDNGSGKTTLLKTISLVLNPKEGEISINEKLRFSDAPTRKQWCRQVLYCYQNPDNQLMLSTVLSELKDVANRLDVFNNEIFERLVNNFQLESFLDENPFDLPAPIKRIICIVSTAIAMPDVLLLDEPTVGLDVQQISALEELIEQRRACKKLTIIISHDSEFFARNISKVIKIDKGKLIYS